MSTTDDIGTDVMFSVGYGLPPNPSSLGVEHPTTKLVGLVHYLGRVMLVLVQMSQCARVVEDFGHIHIPFGRSHREPFQSSVHTRSSYSAHLVSLGTCLDISHTCQASQPRWRVFPPSVPACSLDRRKRMFFNVFSIG